MAKIPQQYTDQPEMVNAVIEARRIQMETEDTSFAIEWLMEHYPMSLNSATRVLEDETFLYVALYPEGHPGLEALRAEQRAKSRRSYNMKKLRPQIIDRDDSRCQNCNKRVKGGDATLDHKDPEGPETPRKHALAVPSLQHSEGETILGNVPERHGRMANAS